MSLVLSTVGSSSAELNTATMQAAKTRMDAFFILVQYAFLQVFFKNSPFRNVDIDITIKSSRGLPADFVIRFRTGWRMKVQCSDWNFAPSLLCGKVSVPLFNLISDPPNFVPPSNLKT